jgi:hypothetical protein
LRRARNGLCSELAGIRYFMKAHGRLFSRTTTIYGEVRR